MRDNQIYHVTRSASSTRTADEDAGWARTTPGEHYFLARAENWSCVKANLAAGKQYVIKANPMMGVWKARVAFDPVTKADYEKQAKDVQKWLAKMQPMAPNPQKVDA